MAAPPREPVTPAAPAGGRKLPAGPDAIRNHFIRKFVQLAAWMMVPVVLSYALLYALRGQWLLAVAEGVGAVLIALSYRSTKRREDPMFGLQAMATVTWVLLAVVIFMHGGLRSPAVLWMAMLAPLAFLAGAPLALWMAGASVTFMIGLYTVESLGWMPAYADVPLAQRVVSAALIIVLFVVFARNALAWRNGIAAELREARDAALEANRLKDRFIANLNHELRTPLNAMIGSAQLLARQSQNPDQQHLLHALQRSADHLLMRVNDVLDHSRLEAGMVQIEQIPFSLGTQLHDVAAMFAPAARAKGLMLELRVDPALADKRMGDPTRLRQVAANLLSNAVKFTATGGVTISARDEPGGDGTLWLRLEVEDSGSGIAADARARLFEPFVQADPSIGRKHGGTGLGLTICRELAQLMGGRIDIETGRNGGALFSVQLPLAVAETAATPAAIAVPPVASLAPATGRRSPRVLVVEDNPVNLMVVQAMLQSLGAQVLTAQDGEQALAMLELEEIDLVLMDLQMPGIDGITATRLWREHERTHGLPATRIIALTGEAHDAARRDCAAAGMNGFLSKPLALDDLDVVLQRLQAAP